MAHGLSAAAFLIALCAPAIARSAGVEVSVHVTGIEQQKGEIFAGLYDASTWTGDNFLSAAHVAVTGGEATLHLTAPGPGRYAVKMFHDLDGSGTLSKNLFGIPVEPYAFSNNAAGRMGPPAFGTAAFPVGATGAQQEIQIR